jgi:asparagine N-glycosylation enzyme membrane subunit Stt3
MTFFKPITAWHDIAANIRAYAEIHSAEGYFRQATSMSELGIPLLLVGLAGIILMLRRKETRGVVLAWIWFAAVLIASFMGKSFRPFRSFLPLIAPLCIAAAIALSYLVDWARRGARPQARLVLTAVLIAGLTGSLGFSSYGLERQRVAHKDSRVDAISWLRKNVRKNETILAIQELFILPAEWKRITARPTTVSWLEASALLGSQRFDYIVTGDFDLRFASDPDQAAAVLARWKNITAPLPVQAECGVGPVFVVPYVWHTNDERILILRGTVR